MRPRLDCHGETWEIHWGLNLLGSAPDCDIRLPPVPGLQDHAGVLLRWIDVCILFAIPGPSGITVSGEAIDRHVLRAESETPSRRINFGPVETVFIWDQTAKRGDLPPSGDHLSRILHLAEAFGRGLTRHREGHPDEIAIGDLFRSICNFEAPQRVTTESVALKSLKGFWPEIRLDVSDHDGDYDIRRLSEDFSIALDEFLSYRSTVGPRSKPPTYTECILDLPGAPLHVGAHRSIQAEDIPCLPGSTLKRSGGIAVMTTINGIFDIVDLQKSPGMRLDGKPRRRIKATFKDSITFDSFEMKVSPTGFTDTSPLPWNIFQALAAPVPIPVQTMRLGLLLPELGEGTDWLLAHLLFGLQSLGATGIALLDRNRGPASGLRISREPDGSLGFGDLNDGWLLARLLLIARSNRGVLVSDDICRDSRVQRGTGGQVLDRVWPCWGPMILRTVENGPTLLAWKPPESTAFSNGVDRIVHLLLDRIISRASTKSKPLGPIPIHRESPKRHEAFLSSENLNIPLTDFQVIGREGDCDVRIVNDGSISRHHAIIAFDGQYFRLYDFRSTNGVFLGKELIEEAVLEDGAALRIANVRFKFRWNRPGPKTARTNAGPVRERYPVAISDSNIRAAWAILTLGHRLSSSRDADERTRLMQECAEWGIEARDHALLQRMNRHIRGRMERDIHEHRIPRLEAEGHMCGVWGPTWIGAGSACSLRLKGREISQLHALVLPIRSDPSRLRLLDFKSSAGTILASESVDQALLKDGDLFQIGESTVRCVIPASTDADASLLREEPSARRIAHLLSTGHTLALNQGNTDPFGPVAARIAHLYELSRVILLSPGNPTIVSDWTAVAETAPCSKDFMLFDQVHQCLEEIRQDRCARLFSLSEPGFYRASRGKNFPLNTPGPERSLLGVPLGLDPQQDGILILTSQKPATVAFHLEDISGFMAIGRILMETWDTRSPSG